jgi:hypothetical protein
MEKRFIAFFDLLGFKNALESADESILSNIHDLVTGIAKFAQKHVSKAIPNDTGTNASFQIAPEISSFSDHIVISIAVPGSAPEPGTFSISPYIAFSGLIDLVSAVCAYALFHGFLMRGGITYGEIYHDGTVVYGLGLNETVAMEERGKSPRILISRTALTFLNQPLDNTGANPNIYFDEDGQFYLNWLFYPHWHNLGIHSLQQHYEALTILASIITANLKKLLGLPPYKYWRWQADYFNRSLGNLARVVNPNLELDYNSLKIDLPPE